MKLPHEKQREECSRFYKIGYEMGFKAAILFLIDHQKHEHQRDLAEYLTSVIVELHEDYNKYPTIKAITLPQELQHA